MTQGPLVVMLCTRARGGMRSVIEQYQHDSLFDRWNVRLINTHDNGSGFLRARIAIAAAATLLVTLAFKQVRLIHIHAAMRGSFWRKNAFALMARSFGVPVVFHLHGSEFKQFIGGLSPFWRSIAQRLLESHQAIIVLSQTWADFVQQVAPRANIVVLPNYVTLPPPQTTALTANEQPTGLFLGLIGARKGVYDLLLAVARVSKKGIKFKIRLGGNGEVKQAQAQAKELGIEAHVDFLGWISGDDKSRELAHADFYVLPSHNEGLPVSVLEAMAHGLPVISTTVGGIPELIQTGENGLLVPPGDVHALADAIEAIVQDASARQKFGRAARNTIETAYNKEIVLPRLESLYEKHVKSFKRH